MNRALVLRRPTAIYYGWLIVAGALVAQFISAGTQAYVSGAFLKPMIDARGPRRLMLIGTAICGASLILTSQVNELWQFYLVRGVGQTVGNAMLGNLVVNVTLAKWFVLRRGMAIAIASAGVSTGGVLMTPVAAWWIDEYGWRSAWVLLGVVVVCLMVPASFVMRRSPGESGLLPDGLTEAEAVEYVPRTHGHAAHSLRATGERVYTACSRAHSSSENACGGSISGPISAAALASPRLGSSAVRAR